MQAVSCTDLTVGTEADMDIREISLQGAVELLPDEQLACLDIFGDRALLSVSRKFAPGELGFREEGYSAETKRIVAYSLTAGNAEIAVDLTPSLYVASGALSAKGFAFTTIAEESSDMHERGAVSIELYNGGDQHISVDAGNYATTGYGDPRIVRLGDGYAFSFNDELGLGEFGVKTLSMDGEVRTALSFEPSEEERFLSNEISSNGSKFVYFAAAHSKGTFFIGDVKSVRSFELDANERLYVHTLTLDHAFICTELINSENAHIAYAITFVDFNGIVIARDESVDSYYRRVAVGDGKSGVVAQDYAGNVYALLQNGETVKKKIIDIPPNPTSFFNTDASVVYSYYSADSGEIGKLYRVKL
jgi:hypothetical protein